jgi:uncharacterized protein (TIGR02598 family)
MKSLPFNRRGFSLVEVTFAIGVVSFCMLSALALLPLGITASHDSLEMTSAVGIASEISSDLRSGSTLAGSGTGTTTPRFQINTTAGTTTTLFFGADDSFSHTVVQGGTSASVYRATVTMGTATAGLTQPVRILVTWPALADPNGAQAPSNYTGSLDVSTAVNSLSP